MAVSKRNLSQGIGAFDALASLGRALGLKKVDALAKGSAGLSGKTTFTGHCRMCMLCAGCGFVATLENGVVTNIEGDPKRKTNAGTMCPRGKGAIMNLYNPKRIKAPMKRTNPEKGMDIDPGWVEITWDEALSIAGKKVREVYDRDPRELVHSYGFAAYESSHATFGMGHWAQALGTPNISSVKGQFCAIHYGGCFTMTAIPTVGVDAANVKYLVSVGKSGGMESGLASGDSRAFANALRNGMHSIIVGPYCNIEASKGEWIPTPPGTDLSFIYALMYCFLYELNEFDKEFVGKRTNASYLIDSDGEYVRGDSGKPQIWDLENSSSKDFDDETLLMPALEGSYKVNGKSCVPSFSLFKDHLKTFTPEWASEINTIPASTIRRIAFELIENASIGSTIVIEGKEMPLRPAAVIVGRSSMNQEDGSLLDIFSRVLNMLLGNIGVPGGVVSTMASDYARNPDGVVEPIFEAATCNSFSWPPQHLDLFDFFPHRHSTNTLMWHVIQDPEKWGFDYKPSLFISSAANPIMGNSNGDHVIEALKKLDYVIYHACYNMDEMAMMSDLLLPEHATLEQTAIHFYVGNEGFITTGDDDFTENHRAIVLRKGIGPQFNTMDGNDQIIGMFEKAGLLPILNESVNAIGCLGIPMLSPKFDNPEYLLDPNKKYSVVEMWDRNLKSAFGPDKGMDFLEKNPIMPLGNYSKSEVYPSEREQNKMVRFPLYLIAQKQSGDFLIPELAKTGADLREYVGVSLEELRARFTAVPYYPEHRSIHEAPEEYDLLTFTYRQPMFMFQMSSQDQNPISRDYGSKFMPDYNAIMLNEITAEAKGIASGDLIVVESQYGKTHGKAYLSGRCHLNTIGIGGKKGRKSRALGKELLNDTNYNELLPGGFGHVDPLHGGVICTTPVKIYKYREDGE